MTVVVSTPRIYTVHGVPLSVTGIAQVWKLLRIDCCNFSNISKSCNKFLPQVKITSNNEEMLRAAVEQFSDKTEKEIQDVARVTLEGHQRAIMGALTVDEIFKDRKKFAEQVFDCASTDLFNMGIQVSNI